MPKTKYEVMLSSSFEDLRDHRQATLEAMREVGLEPINMEHRPQPPSTNTLGASLGMVNEADGFIGIVSHRYGTIDEDPARNPNGYSLSEVEYRRALDRKIPMSMFVMSEEHMVKPAHVESSAVGREKLAIWKQHVSQTFTYSRFDSLDDFRKRIRSDLEALKKALDELHVKGKSTDEPAKTGPARAEPIRAPEFLAMPPYTPGHDFVGRTRELILLDDWAKQRSACPVLLFEAIGGMGKSMLTWHWVQTRANGARADFAGVFWYSFYERGAEMLDFARHALAYVSDTNVEEFSDWKTRKVAAKLLPLLAQRPWLFVLDGVERLLVAYHRIDAAQIRDEEIDDAKDPDAAGSPQRRNTRECIRDDDQTLLTQLAQCEPSKILITSRVMPSALLNRSGEPLPGVRHQKLAGLDPRDAESILRRSGIEGDGETIQLYLQKHFDCHPLVVGVVAGLVRNYRKAPGDFHAWMDDSEAGAVPHLSQWDVIQRRNHILKCAFDDLQTEQRQLLAYLALITEACDFSTVNTLNPYRPPPPEEAPDTAAAAEFLAFLQQELAGADSAELKQELQDQISRARNRLAGIRARRAAYADELATWKMLESVRRADMLLTGALTDLEQRGLLQWNRSENSYDLHPVVRGYALDSLAESARLETSERVANHFESRRDPPYETASALFHLRYGLQVYRALIMGGQFDRAFSLFQGDISTALFVNLQLPREVLSLLRPLFPDGWSSCPKLTNVSDQIAALNLLGWAFAHLDEDARARQCFEALLGKALQARDPSLMCLALVNLSDIYATQSVARAARAGELVLQLAKSVSEDEVYRIKRKLADLHGRRGALEDAEKLWAELAEQPIPNDRGLVRPGEMQEDRATAYLIQGRRDEAKALYLEALDVATKARNRLTVRTVWSRLGQLYLADQQFNEAGEACETAIRMLRESGMCADWELTQLALIRARSGHPTEARHILSRMPESAYNYLTAEVYLELGELDKAAKLATGAFRESWGDGPPFAQHEVLVRSKAVLDQIGQPVPELPAFDPAKIEPIHFESEVLAFIQAQEQDREKAKQA